MQKPSGSCLDDILSQADIILPAQYFESVRSSARSGEQRLMLALLIDAINVLQNWKGNGNPHKRRDFAEAVQWVNTRGTHHPFSFDSVCDVLDIDSEVLRSRLRTLTVRGANSAPRPCLGHLRLKEIGRSKHVTANRPSRRKAVRIRTATAELTPAAPKWWPVQREPNRECTEEPSGGLVAFGNLSAPAVGESVTW